jgi:predicted nucleotidyltransferase
MNFLQIDLTKLRHESFEPLFEVANKVFSELNIDFYIIGAIARDIWVSGRFNQKVSRITRDLDLAIFLNTSEDYDKLIKVLTDTGTFREVKDTPHRLVFKESILIDIIPFGEYAEIDGMVRFGEKGFLNISVLGFSEVFERATEVVEFNTKYLFKVCTLPGIVLLKLIAYDDRPEMRPKDVKDILLIIENYLEFYFDDIVDNHYDLFNVEPFDQIRVSARMIGREMKIIANHSEELQSRIISIIEKHIGNPDRSKMLQLMVGQKITSVEEAAVVMSGMLVSFKQ